MNQKLALAVSSLALVLLSACSTTPSAPAADANAPAVNKGGQLVSATGDKLFTYSKDAAGKSNCVRDCLKPFRPMFSAPDDKAVGDFATIERPDGMSQWTYKGSPLYLCPVPTVAKGAPEKAVKAAAKKAADCAKGASNPNWVAAKP